jgi:hypothetical protein
LSRRATRLTAYASGPYSRPRSSRRMRERGHQLGRIPVRRYASPAGARYAILARTRGSCATALARYAPRPTP